MNAAIELHDSKLERIIHSDGFVVVRLAPAFVHRTTGRPGFDDGICEAQNCELIFKAGHIEGPVGELPTHILDGTLQVESEQHANMILLPCRVDLPATLTLHLADDYRRIAVSGTGVEIRLSDEVVFIKQFRPSR